MVDKKKDEKAQEKREDEIRESNVGQEAMASIAEGKPVPMDVESEMREKFAIDEADAQKERVAERKEREAEHAKGKDAAKAKREAKEARKEADVVADDDHPTEQLLSRPTDDIRIGGYNDHPWGPGNIPPYSDGPKSRVWERPRDQDAEDKARREANKNKKD